MKHNRRRSTGKPRVSPTVLDRINPNVAGIDCGAAEHFVAVPPDRDPTPVQSFKAFTSDLLRLADWLTTCRVTSVAIILRDIVAGHRDADHLARHRDHRCRASTGLSRPRIEPRPSFV